MSNKPMASANTGIEAHALTKDFNDFRAVDSITMTVEPGTVYAILGPNGAGKTTTVRMLTSILIPTSGTAVVAGYNVVTHPAEVRASVGVLTEQHGLYERMKAMDYLNFFGRLYHLTSAERKSRAMALMQRFGLADALDRRLGEYSKGMKQKLALVRSMLHNPPVLLLDEPTSAMDPQSAKLVRDAILELKQDRRTIILTTHNLSEAQILADKIGVIRRGRLVVDGSFDQLRHRFVGDPIMEIQFTAPLNGTRTAIERDLSSTFGDQVRVESAADDDLIRYRTPTPTQVNPALIKLLTDRGASIVTLSEVRKSLEEVYLQIVAEDEGLHGDGMMAGIDKRSKANG